MVVIDLVLYLIFSLVHLTVCIFWWVCKLCKLCNNCSIHRELFFCVAVGLWAGLIIGITTEYFTSNAYRHDSLPLIVSIVILCLHFN